MPKDLLFPAKHPPLLTIVRHTTTHGLCGGGEHHLAVGYHTFRIPVVTVAAGGFVQTFDCIEHRSAGAVLSQIQRGGRSEIVPFLRVVGAVRHMIDTGACRKEV